MQNCRGRKSLYSLRSRHRCFGGRSESRNFEDARTRGKLKRSCSPRALYKHLPKKLSPNHQANPCKSPMHELLVYVEEFDKIYPCQAKLVKTSLILQWRVQAFRCLAVADSEEGPERQKEKIGGTAPLPHPYLTVLIRRCFVRFFTSSTHLPAAMN